MIELRSVSMWADTRQPSKHSVCRFWSVSIPRNTRSSPRCWREAQKCQTTWNEINMCLYKEAPFNRISLLWGEWHSESCSCFYQLWVTWWQRAQTQSFSGKRSLGTFVIPSKLQTLYHSTLSSHHNILIGNCGAALILSFTVQLYV